MCGESFLSLTQLYMPIIGIDSYGLYAALSTLKENEKHSFKKLLDMLNLGSPGLLKKAFEKLEAVALIRSYHHEQRGYLFQLYPPLPRERFLENSLLSSFLASQIGEVELKRLAGEIRIPQLRGYEEVTKTLTKSMPSKLHRGRSVSKLVNFKSATVQVQNPILITVFFKMNLTLVSSTKNSR